MIKTEGLTHIQLVVADLDRSLRFYKQVFGMEEMSATDLTSCSSARPAVGTPSP